MLKLAIIHFNPIELYPPVMNWLDFLAGKDGEDIQVRVYTMHAPDKFKPFTPASPAIKIFRSGPAGWKNGPLKYLAYYFNATMGLTRWRPDTIIYYETLSSFPALVYKKLVRRKTSLFIHFHEYTSSREYERGSLLNRWLHRFEKRSYRLADGISHTNTDRIRLFRNDLSGANDL